MSADLPRAGCALSDLTPGPAVRHGAAGCDEAKVTEDKFKSHIKYLRMFGPTWLGLRFIGNSRPVQIAAVFPVIGYFILLSSQITQFFDGGIAGADAHSGLFDPL